MRIFMKNNFIITYICILNYLVHVFICKFYFVVTKMLIEETLKEDCFKIFSILKCKAQFAMYFVAHFNIAIDK